jgi:hypothetical protein
MTYAATQTRAAALIASKGQAVTITPHTAAAYNVSDGSVALTEAPTVSTTGVLLPLPKGFVHRENVRIGDQQLLLPGDITAPKIGATVTIGGTGYVIVEVSPLNPGGTNLIYDVIVRGA